MNSSTTLMTSHTHSRPGRAPTPTISKTQMKIKATSLGITNFDFPATTTDGGMEAETHVRAGPVFASWAR
jgi:hypothetical protein